MDHLGNMLKELGLNEYETKTYIALLSHGVCKAEEISNLAGIPLPRVYDTVNHLERKGFVLITKTRPQQYMPVKSEEALQNFIGWKRREHDTHLNYLKKLSRDTLEYINRMEIKEKPHEDRWRIWTTTGKRGITSTRNNFIKNSEKELFLMAGDATFIDDEAPLLRRLLRRGVKIKLMLRGTEDSKALKHLDKLNSLGAEIKTGYMGCMRGNVVDNKTALIFLKTGNHGTGTPGTDMTNKYELIVINNPEFVRVVKEHFDMHWKSI